jgi:hypothetical protein
MSGDCFGEALALIPTLKKHALKRFDGGLALEAVALERDLSEPIDREYDVVIRRLSELAERFAADAGSAIHESLRLATSEERACACIEEAYLDCGAAVDALNALRAILAKDVPR